MRVALLTPTYWPEVRRGTERFAHEVGTGLTEAGDAVTLVTSHRARPAATTEGGMRVIRNWRPPDGRLKRRMFEDHLTHVPFTYLSLRRGAFDAPNALLPTDALAAARRSRETGRPAAPGRRGAGGRGAARRGGGGRRARPGPGRGADPERDHRAPPGRERGGGGGGGAIEGGGERLVRGVGGGDARAMPAGRRRDVHARR